jgi:hypothetical protein
MQTVLKDLGGGWRFGHMDHTLLVGLALWSHGPYFACGVDPTLVTWTVLCRQTTVRFDDSRYGPRNQSPTLTHLRERQPSLAPGLFRSTSLEYVLVN